jgi:polysaccharide biosynthesis/export protein
MKNTFDVQRAKGHAAGSLLLVIAGLALSLSATYAQCPSGSAPDALGCPTMRDSSSLLNGSPASVSIENKSQIESPDADTFNGNLDRSSLSGEKRRAGDNLSQSRYSRETTPRNPEPLTEFQRFVAASTGQILPIYGADLFSTIPASFGPLDQGPAPGAMIVGTDDELRVRVWGQVNFSSNLRVNREGEIYIPKVGAVHMAGLPFSEVPAHLRSVMERVYRNFDLSVDMGEIHSIQIYITGLANRPGEYTVNALSTLVNAIFSSGGPSAAGSMRHVLLKRSGKVVTDFDLYALLISGDKTGDVQLQPGDVLYIPAAGPEVALLGSVRQAGIYELRGKETIDNLLDAAGGRTTIASGAHISLERIEDRARRRAFDIKTDAMGLATPLADGDIVRIDPIISTYRETVTLRGAVANPGHFAWHEGMRLSELMPDRDSLLRRDYWWSRTQLGLPAPEFSSSLANPNQAPSPLHPIQNPTQVSSTANSNSNPKQTRGPNSTEPTKLVVLTSPEAQTNWNYAVIERVSSTTMQTTLIPFSLGRLVLDHDMSQDLSLMAGDVITVFTQSDIQIPMNEQTKYVTLEGEFVHPGVYSASPDETLHSVVQRAGGLTKQAYLYAASFTRKSTQMLEQQHMNEFADELEHQLARSSMTSVGGSELNSAASQQVLLINRELAARIRGTRASGRVVLDMHPQSNGDYELPDMHLEDGDRLVVPFVPETVQVLGAVFNPHAFIFHQDAKAGEYLRLAGGPNREADRKQAFILRADGTVSSRDSNSSSFSHGFNGTRLHPGDSIVMPEKKMHIPALAQVLGWTQVLSQAALPAVAATALTH